MKTKSWHLNRRELLKGGGIALALPLLNGMSLAAPSKTHPKRMLVSYFPTAPTCRTASTVFRIPRSRTTNGAGGRAAMPVR